MSFAVTSVVLVLAVSVLFLHVFARLFVSPRTVSFVCGMVPVARTYRVSEVFPVVEFTAFIPAFVAVLVPTVSPFIALVARRMTVVEVRAIFVACVYGVFPCLLYTSDAADD